MPIGFFKNLVQKFTGRPVDWDELEETLIRADLGVPLTLEIISTLQARGEGVTAEDVAEVTRGAIVALLPKVSEQIRPLPDKPKAILIVGVNGTGKTTSTAKLAHYFKTTRHTVMLAAADTFRAAAIEQLAIWAERLDVEMIRGNYNGDPAALCYDAWTAAAKKDVEFLVCDTSGRLHNRANSSINCAAHQGQPRQCLSQLRNLHRLTATRLSMPTLHLTRSHAVDTMVGTSFRTSHSESTRPLFAMPE